MVHLFGWRHHEEHGKQAAEPAEQEGTTSAVYHEPPRESHVQPRPPPSEQEQQKLRELEQFATEFRQQSPPKDVTYRPLEDAFLSDPGVYHRYLRATRGDLKHAKRRLQDTIEWRRDFRPDCIPPDDVAVEGTSGKQILTGYDREGRPILYLRPGRENTKPSPRQVRYLVWSLERGINLMPPGQESMCIIVDFHGASLATTPSLGTARQVANILQNHYVERLGRAFVCNTPKFVNAFFTALSPFLDPITKDKIRFNDPEMTRFIDPAQLDAQFGGQYRYAFDFQTYWESLMKHCGVKPDGTRVPPEAGK